MEMGRGGALLRMSVEEGETMDEDTTAAMAHMAVTLHEEYGFTDACATDGSRIPAPDGAGAGSVHAWPRDDFRIWGVP